MEKRYTVGWIAALSIELTAAIQMLDEQHDPPADYLPQPRDNNVYVFGRVGDHNVIIAFLEAGAYGTVPTATTANDLFRSFPSIRMCLLVGIGAGIRRKGFDVRLGDVVISQPDGKSGGVYQYDLQKARPDGQLEKIGILNRPSPLLLKILKRVQAHHHAHPSKVKEYTKRITPKMESNKPGYVHQGLENDRLFKSTFSHVSESPAVDHEDFDFDDSDTGEPSKTCPHCPSEEEVKRQERPSGTDPQFHYGTIASGNTLVKDAKSRNKIVAQVPGNCICFEMEAAGLMNSFPCLVIRGICDYADSHKNDRWQPYAALTAAAYAREFLQFAPRGDVEMEQPLVEQLEDIGRTMQSIQNSLQVAELEKWLSPVDPSVNYHSAIDKRNEGLSESGRWLLESQEFLEWKDMRGSFLWLYGLAGCGKTILCSTVIEHLTSETEHATSETDRIVLYFYFAFNDQRTRSKGSLLRSLIMQLSRYNERAMKELVEQKKDAQPSDQKLEEIFMSMATLVKQVTIVLDGIDELKREEDKRGDVLMWINEAIKVDIADIQILASSRNEMDIAAELKSIHLTVQLTPGTVEEDIKAFVRKHIDDESSRLHRWHKTPRVQAEIANTLTEKANGMFRWVSCQIQAIQNCLNLKSLRKQLSSLPKTLDETYERIIQDLQGTQQWDAIRLLQFLAFADRPLELFEAIDLLAVDVPEAETETENDTPPFDPENRMPEPLEIVEACSSLVVLDSHNPERKRLQLAHFTVKEYLVSGRISPDLLKYFDEICAHSSIVKMCLGYLESVLPSITSIWVNTPDDMDTSNRDLGKADWEHDQSRFPLMDYAINTWPAHARLCNQDPVTAMQIQRFFSHKSCLINWLFCFCCKHFFPVQVRENAEFEASCPVLLSIYLGFGDMALRMINNVELSELKKEDISEDVLRCLIPNYYLDDPYEHGMAYDISDEEFALTSHLYLAAERGMHDVVKALIKKGVDVHKDGGEMGTALNAVCDNVQGEIIATLLQHSRDCSSQDSHEKYVKEALEMFVENLHIYDNYENYIDYDSDAIVSTRDQLVESCLALDNPGSLLDYCLRTVFFGSDLDTAHRSLDLARRLVRRGARVDVVADLRFRDRYIFDNEDFLLSFLHLFSGEEPGNVDPHALQKLFARGSRDGNYPMTQRIIEEGFNEVLSFMIAHGVDRECYFPLAQSGLPSHPRERTILFRAVERRNTMAVQILLNVNERLPYTDDLGDYTPSISYINKAIGDHRLTCLHEAARWNCTEIMTALLSCNADLEAQDWIRRTPLHYACEHFSLDAVKLLVERGANLQALDFYEKTPLQVARDENDFWGKKEAVVQWLEQQNSQLSSHDDFHPKRENEADNDDSSYTERDSKRQKTG